jgi:hypothetical protein
MLLEEVVPSAVPFLGGWTCHSPTVKQRAKPVNKEASRSVSKAHVLAVSIAGGWIRSVRHLRSDYKNTSATVETIWVCCYKVLCPTAQRMSRGAAWSTGAYSALPGQFDNYALSCKSHSALGLAI